MLLQREWPLGILTCIASCLDKPKSLAALLQASTACATAVSAAKLKGLEIESALVTENFLVWLLQRHRTEHLEEVRAGYIGGGNDGAVLPTLMKLLEGAPALRYLAGWADSYPVHIQLDVTTLKALQSLCVPTVEVSGQLPSKLQELVAGGLQLNSGAQYPHSLQVVQLDYCALN
jgi:hypothetical protein